MSVLSERTFRNSTIVNASQTRASMAVNAETPRCHQPPAARGAVAASASAGVSTTAAIAMSGRRPSHSSAASTPDRSATAPAANAPIAYPPERDAVYQPMTAPARRPPLMSMATARLIVPRLPKANPWTSVIAMIGQS